MELPVIFRMGKTDGRGAQSPGIGKLCNENIGNIVSLLCPENIVLALVVEVCMIQGEICKGRCPFLRWRPGTFFHPFSRQGILVFTFQAMRTDPPGGLVGNSSRYSKYTSFHGYNGFPEPRCEDSWSRC